MDNSYRLFFYSIYLMPEEYNIFVYGSLMSVDELKSMFDDYEYMRVKAAGFMRDFSKEAHSWGPDGEKTGVMAIRRMKEESCNGLLVTGITKNELKDYSERETGYDIEEIDTTKLEPYESGKKIPETVLTAIVDWELDEPNTDEEYYELCIAAASSHGTEFLEDFFKTTYLFYGAE